MKLCIVGGGTTGWWTAAYFESQFPDWDISLYESDEIKIIGVGESTLPQIGIFLEECGLRDEDWMDAANAVVKYGNVKRHWHDENDDSDFDWTFWYNDNNEFDEWLPKYLAGNKTKQDLRKDLYRSNERRATGYHMDANLAGIVVKKHCKRVKHFVQTLDKLPEGYDFYIDCTGPARRFTIDKTVIKPEGHLVNAAWVRPAMLPENYEYNNMTVSIARPYGWQFQIVLQHRLGTGYVFNRHMLTPEQALIDFVDYTKDLEPYNNMPPRYIEWEPEYLVNPWTDNVATIGFASGWVDPLEANSLYVAVYSIRTLARCLKRGLKPEAFNRSMRNIWRENCEFIWHHYALSKRNDTPFWQYYTQQDATKSVWENYQKRGNWETNFYSDSLYAMLGLTFDEFTHYSPKK